MFGVGSTELLVILVIAFLVFGSNKLPEIGASMGKAIRAFRSAGEEPEKVEDKAHSNDEKGEP
ncbi:twin-arginine translocase TatA/TatE family subunit [Desulfovibrio aminophilus]|nr:twin-arginine translocase TatA/TatE family subunit [Desulfovibrio aminophilus]MCM0756183.1 twin-arginine translocase TatA/TatE family subunit [Desulfovibrio aminophilus]